MNTKHIIVLGVLGIFGLLGASACEVSAGIGGGVTCDVCGDALANGSTGDWCTGTDAADYSSLSDCGCNGGPCADVCADNLCSDLGDTPDCDACLSANCEPDYSNCQND
jgi:hypothetical protein